MTKPLLLLLALALPSCVERERGDEPRDEPRDDIVPFESLPRFVASEVLDVRGAPDGSFLAVGFPPTLIAARAGQTAPPEDWAEAYVVDGALQLWRSDGEIVELGAAEARHETRELVVGVALGRAQVFAKPGGDKLAEVEGVEEVDVEADVAVLDRATTVEIWTGAVLVAVAGESLRSLEILSASTLLVRVNDVGNFRDHLVDRASGAVSPLAAGLAPLPDGRFLRFDADATVIVDGEDERVLCTDPGPLGAELRGDHVRCGQTIVDLDGALVAELPVFTNFEFSPSGQGFVLKEQDDERRVRFADGIELRGLPALERGGPRRLGARWTPDETGVVVDGFSVFTATSSSGEDRPVLPTAGFRDSFLDEDAFFVVGDEVEALNFATMTVRSLTTRDGSPSTWTMSEGRLTLLAPTAESTAALQIESPLGAAREVIDAGPFDVLFRPTGDVVVAGGADGLSAFPLPDAR